MCEERRSLRPDDHKTLELLRFISHQLFSDFDPAPLPEGIEAFLRRATRHELQAVFIDAFERLRASYDNGQDSTDS